MNKSSNTTNSNSGKMSSALYNKNRRLASLYSKGAIELIKEYTLDITGRGRVKFHKFTFVKKAGTNRPASQAASWVRGLVVEAETGEVVVRTYGSTPVSKPVGSVTITDSGKIEVTYLLGSKTETKIYTIAPEGVTPYIEGITPVFITSDSNGKMVVNTHGRVVREEDDKDTLIATLSSMGITGRKLFKKGRLSSSQYYFLVVDPNNTFSTKREFRNTNHKYCVFLKEENSPWHANNGGVPGKYNHEDLPVDKLGKKGRLAPQGVVKLPKLNAEQIRKFLIYGYGYKPNDSGERKIADAYVKHNKHNSKSPVFSSRGGGEPFHLAYVGPSGEIRGIRCTGTPIYARQLIGTPDVMRTLTHALRLYKISTSEEEGYYKELKSNYTVSVFKSDTLDMILDQLEKGDFDVDLWYGPERIREDIEQKADEIRQSFSNDRDFDIYMEKLVTLQVVLSLPPIKYEEVLSLGFKPDLSISEALTAENVRVAIENMGLFLKLRDRLEEMDNEERASRLYQKSRRYKLVKEFEQYVDLSTMYDEESNAEFEDRMYNEWLETLDVNKGYSLRKELSSLKRAFSKRDNTGINWDEVIMTGNWGEMEFSDDEE